MDVSDLGLDGALVLLIGPPASGKSTFAARLVDAGVVASDDVLSSDAIAVERAVGGAVASGGNPEQVFAELRRRIRDRMAAGRPSVVDATQLWPRRRAQHLRIARAHGRPVVGVVFVVPLDELLRRNLRRLRPVPTGAVVAMSRQAELVSAASLHDEGFDRVVVVDQSVLPDRVDDLP